ncbi:uncharacterized protein LOC129716963 [Wyeomyia smithii]|uniref:uncharacterized protein LOC129716963 n=1 Tax=Wyeomyia smithii TaxID=174621 RepID=UPI002467F1D6|nr:uncharacterized protein LOC129716963 [Wyeomyia smithii]
MVVPSCMRQRLLQLAHEGHPGRTKMQQRLRLSYWWPRMDEDIAHKVDGCEGCRLVSHSDRPEPMERRRMPEAPWIDLAIDFLGPLPSGDYLLVIIVYYSRYKEVEILQKITANETADRLEKIFIRLGFPRIITLDNGRQFVSTEFDSYCRNLSTEAPPTEHGDCDLREKEKGKDAENLRRRAKPSYLGVGDEVHMKNVLSGNKLTSTFNASVMTVTAKHGSRVTVQNNETGKSYDRNSSHLKRVAIKNGEQVDDTQMDPQQSDEPNPASSPNSVLGHGADMDDSSLNIVDQPSDVPVTDEDEQPDRARSRREIRKPKRFEDCLFDY